MQPHQHAGADGASRAQAENRKPVLGLIAILACNVIWGVLPLYWRGLELVPPYQIVCQRIFWSCLVLALLLVFLRKTTAVADIFRHKKNLLILAACSFMISMNWLIYISMVNSGQVILASLSTYLSPLFTVALGVLVLKDRLSPAQRLALVLALGGVLVQVYIRGSLPLAALFMSFSSALYGLLRARLNVDIKAGIFVENLLALPVVTAFLVHWQFEGVLVFAQGAIWQDALLIGTGIITAFPLILLVFALRNARMSTVGLMQFVAPCMIFLMGVFVFKEEFTLMHFASFALIWAGLVTYSFDSFKRFNRHAKFRGQSKKTENSD